MREARPRRGKGKKERKQIRKNFQGLSVPPPVRTRIIPVLYRQRVKEFPHQVRLFPTGMAEDKMSGVS